MPSIPPGGKREIEAMEALLVYFDANVNNDVAGQRTRVQLGFIGFRPPSPILGPPIFSHTFAGSIGEPIGSWDEELRVFWDDHRQDVLDSTWVVGAQVYDLVAAHGAALHLRTNGFRGAVRMLGDGREVIDFLKGRDDAIRRVKVGKTNLAEAIRRGIRGELKALADVRFEWVSSETNLADSSIREAVAELSQLQAVGLLPGPGD